MSRYDWDHARRGYWAGKLRMGDCNRVLDQDLAEIFPDSESVNEALRALVRVGSRVKRAAPTPTKKKHHAA